MIFAVTLSLRSCETWTCMENNSVQMKVPADGKNNSFIALMQYTHNVRRYVSMVELCLKCTL